MSGKYMTAGCAVLSLAFLLAASPAKADDISVLKDEIRKQQELLRQQQDAMKGLQQRLQELEGRQKTVEGTQKDLAEKTRTIEESQHAGQHGEGVLNEMQSKFGANLGAFASIQYSSKSREQANNHFSIGETSLYSTASYGDRLNFLMELQIEMEEDMTELDLERLWVGYTFSDLLTVRAGRQHTALGYWNKTYHHGKQLYNTVDRPFFLAFEHDGGIMPLHVVGLELEGSMKTSLARIKYELEFGNNPKIGHENKLEVNSSSDDRNSKQAVLRLSARPERFPWMNVGVFGSTFTVNTTGKKHLRESIMGADFSYSRSNFELLAEYFRLRNAKSSASAYYVQLGYTFKQAFTPYVRYEQLNVEDGDPYFSDLESNADRRQIIAGIKYDIDPLKSSLKLQYRNDKERGSKTYNVFETQWSFNF